MNPVLACLAVAAAAVGALVWVRSRFIAVRVVGTSMEPTLREGAWVLVRRVPLRRVRRGQVVVFAPLHRIGAAEDPPWLIKRVAALPGDPMPAGVRSPDELVPPGQFAVLGDNTQRSYDSRTGGLFPAGALLGVAVRVLSGAGRITVL